MDEEYQSYDAACAQQEEEAARFAAELTAQMIDRLAYDAWAAYVDRVLDLTVGRALP